MAILMIVLEGDPVLRRKAKEISKVNKRLRNLAKDMLETMHDAKGVGLAAPQVGISERLVVIDTGEESGPYILFNPKIISRTGENKDVEGCLSIPGRNEYITRAEKVSVTGMNLEGRQVTVTGQGLLARALQHEIDHLDGILFIDYLT
ncbi:MAG TPA: peptide deformylase [Bacillota bacterium]